MRVLDPGQPRRYWCGQKRGYWKSAEEWSAFGAYHSLNPVAGLSKRRIYPAKLIPAHIESVADKIQGPLMSRRFRVAQVIDLLVIGRVFYDSDRSLGQRIHSNDVHSAGSIRGNIEL